MAFKDLPLTSVAGFTGTIGQFVQVIDGADGKAEKIVLNPNGKAKTTVDDRASAARYLKEVFPVLFDYSVLKVGQHTKFDVSATLGFRENAGAIKQGVAYVGTYALDGTLVPNGVPFKDNQLFFHLALDSMLQYTVEVDAAKAGVQELAESIKMILNAPDAATAETLRRQLIEERQEARQMYRAAKSMASAPAFVKPASLTVTIDGVQTDAYTGIPVGTKLFAVNQATGAITKASITWDRSDTAIQFLMDHPVLSTQGKK